MSLIQGIDDQLLSILQTSISRITDNSFAIYDCSGVLLLQMKSKDGKTASLESYTSDKKFIQDGIRKALTRNDPSLFRDPQGIHHIFIPVKFNSKGIVLISGTFNLEKAEFEAISAPIKSLTEIFLELNYEKNSHNKGYKRTKTLMDILSGIRLPTSTARVYSFVLDIIILLYDVDTASVLVQSNDLFKTSISSGRLSRTVTSLCLEKNNPLISQSIRNLSPVFDDNIENIYKLGFPANIKSIYVFPFSDRSKNYGLLLLYNAFLSDEESQKILDFCKIMSVVLGHLNLQNAYLQGIADMETLDMVITQLIPHFHETDALCKIILNKAMEIVKAEKGSLMLSQGNSLAIKVAEGVNRWLLQDIVVKEGEGIAGKAFRDGKPIYIKNVDDIKLPDLKPRGRYNTSSFISVPLSSGSETMGVLNITDKRKGCELTEEDFHLISRFASSSSVALKISKDYISAEQIIKHSATDSLTGLFNRQHFFVRLREEIQRSDRYCSIFSFAIVDIDDFRLFNDMEGRPAGDSVLMEIAGKARRCIRVYDILSRFGGEEFGILMPHTNKNNAFEVAERIRENIKESFMLRWKKFSMVTVSIGISSFPADGNNIDELTESADTALYKAKSTGKNKTVVYSLFN